MKPQRQVERLAPKALVQAIREATGQPLVPLLLVAKPALLTPGQRAQVEQDMRRARMAQRRGKEVVLVHHPETGERLSLKPSEVLPPSAT